PVESNFTWFSRYSTRPVAASTTDRYSLVEETRASTFHASVAPPERANSTSAAMSPLANEVARCAPAAVLVTGPGLATGAPTFRRTAEAAAPALTSGVVVLGARPATGAPMTLTRRPSFV